MITRPSLQGRAALAVALLVGFYLLALGVAGGLLYIPYAEWAYADHVTGRILIFCVGGAIAIIRGILPRRDRFEAPGPIVTEVEQPRLFAAVREVATATNQAMPAEVYLVPEVNAFVAQRGGVMGFGSRRVMGIGLPLLNALTIGQFRAVIAHEFGHYYGGDTKLGPWVYKTRAAIIRTLESLGRHSGGLLQKPFVWYGTAFSRLTLAISRRQEYVADELAARTCGARNLSQALIALERSGTAFGLFLYQEFAGVIDAGFRPPLVEGFAYFQSAPRVSSQLDEFVSKQVESGEAGPYDTHPALRQRLNALAELGDVEVAASSAADDQQAIALVDDVPKVEAALVQSMLKAGTPALAAIRWDDVPTRVLAARWAKLTQQSLPGLDGLTPTIFPEVATRLASDPDALARQLGVHKTDDAENSRMQAEYILGAALCIVLNERRQRTPEEIQLTAAPGEPVLFQFRNVGLASSIEPFAVLDALRSGTLAPAAWIEQCREFGITSDDLGASCHRVGEARTKGVMQAVLR